jgi:hypothetical protein
MHIIQSMQHHLGMWLQQTSFCTTVWQQGTEAEKNTKKQQPEELSTSGVTSL